MTDKAIEAAARSLIDSDPTMNGYHQTHIEAKIPAARAAIIAYLRNVEVTQEMHLAAMNRKSDTLYKGIFEAMCAAKADELENGI